MRTSSPQAPLTIWAVSDGRAGMRNQVLGLAEAVARRVPAELTEKTIAIRPPFGQLPRAFFGPSLSRLSPEGDALDPPYPDLWIGCGRRVVPLSIEIRGRGPFVVQTQDPRAPLDGFDLVVPPRHDGLDGENVFALTGSPNRLTEDGIGQDAETLRAALPYDEGPYAVAMIGGTSKDYRLTGPALSLIMEVLASAEDEGYRVLITPSRRTGDDAIAHLHRGLPEAWIWDGEPVGALDNPYRGMLGLADRLFVTAESANMLTDAAFTGKPVHMLPLEGGAAKWRRFHGELTAHGVLKPDASITDEWTYSALRETDRAAAEILRRMGIGG